MAYIVDLNEEETDVPITSIRSKADCPNNEVFNFSLTILSHRYQKYVKLFVKYTV